jgi:hypothetical protein
MSRRSKDIDELIRQKTLLGSKLSHQDKEYANYAGGSYETASQIAFIDLLSENHILPERIAPYMMFYRDYLIKQRKAFFMTIGSDILTQLAALVGDQRERIDASRRDIRIHIRP